VGHDDPRKGITVNDIPLDHHLEKVEDERRGKESKIEFSSASTKHTTYRKPVSREHEDYRRRGTVKIIPKGAVMRERYEPIIVDQTSIKGKILALLLTRERINANKIKLILDSVSGGGININSVSAALSDIKKTRIANWLEVVDPERKPGEKKKSLSYKWSGPDLSVGEAHAIYKEDFNTFMRKRVSERKAAKKADTVSEKASGEVEIPLPEVPKSLLGPTPGKVSKSALNMTLGDFIESFRTIGMDIEFTIKG